MSIWPFTHRRGGAKLKSTGPEAVAALPVHGVPRKLSKRRSRRRVKPAKPFTALDERDNTKAKDVGDSPLDPIPPASPMDTAAIFQERPHTAGSDGAEDITALPNSRALRTSPHLRPVTQDTADIPYNWNLRTSSHHSLPTPPPSKQRGKLQRNPSRNKRAAHDSPLARRRSSKKRKDEHLREEEIRAMSAPISVPKRGSLQDTGLLRRESKKARGGLNRNLERPMSNISLPLEDSIHSSMSGNSESRNYRLSVLDIVSPRPTIRYTISNPFSTRAPSNGIYRQPSKSEPRARRTLVKQQPGKEPVQDRARVDSLADDLGSTDLRDILERDKRRREKKSKTENERLQRKLERRAEKQRMKELRDQAQNDAATVPMTETIVPDQEVSKEGLGIHTTAKDNVEAHVAEEPTFHMEDIDEAKEPRTNQPEQRARYGEDIPRMPLLSSHGDEDERRTVETPFSEFESPMEEPDVGTAQAIAYTSPPASPVASAVYQGDRSKAAKLLGEDVAMGNYSKASKVLGENVHSASQPPQQPSPRRASGLVEKKRSGMWASIFRREKKHPFESPVDVSPEPSFSNTSRESMSRNIPAHLFQPITTTTRKSGVPVRTQSKFREHLPESPLSPPDSRVQSPIEPSTGAKAIAARRGYIVPSTINTDASSGRRLSSPFDDLAGRGRTDSPVSGSRASNLMSQSLASVDSEGSWLSGKPHRTSRAQKHNSVGTASLNRAADDFSASYEDLEIPDDEYFRRLNSPQPQPELHLSGLSAAINSHKASSTAIAGGAPGTDSDGSGPSKPLKEGQIMHHSGASRQPTVVHREPRVKSSEGLLNKYLESETGAGAENDFDKTPKAEYPTPVGTPTEEKSGDDMTPVRRATSVNLGKGHSRQISAGSAKLLDIPKRNSQSSTPGQPGTPRLPSGETADAEKA